MNDPFPFFQLGYGNLDLVRRTEAMTENLVLEHGYWCDPYGHMHGGAQTGIFNRNTGDFILIEHDCTRWELVDQVILHGHRRGWGITTMKNVIRRLDR